MFWLNDRIIIEISGKDNQDFLQGFITNDIKLLNHDNLIYTAFLNASGRFIADFFIFKIAQNIFIDCHKNHAQEILKKLNLYRLKADVNLKINQDFAIIFNQQNLGYFDPRIPNFGYRYYCNVSDLKKLSPNHLIFYHLARIDHKVPESCYDLIYDKSFIAEYDFDNLNAVSYNKGCYVGQETTARNHFRGMVRKKIFSFEIKNCSKPLIDLINNYNNLNSLQIDYENLKFSGFIDKFLIMNNNHQEIGLVLSSCFNIQTNELKGLALIKIDDYNQLISSDLSFLNNQILIKN